jgi:pimeloyl-ACP methyl ester carboxylesterase
LLAPLLVDKYRVVAPDLLAHGLTAPTRSPTVEEVLDQIQMVVEMYSVSTRPRPPVVLVGNSFGGSMALLAAVRCPELIDAVVVLNAPTPQHPTWSWDPVMNLKRWLISAPGMSTILFKRARSMTPRQVVAGQLRAAGLDPVELDPDAMVAAVALQQVRHQDSNGHASQQQLLRSLLRLFERGRDYGERIQPIEVPVVWLHGQADPLVPESQARAFAEGRPGWEFHSRVDVGHVPQLVDPVWVAERIEALVDTTTAQKSSDVP